MQNKHRQRSGRGNQESADLAIPAEIVTGLVDGAIALREAAEEAAKVLAMEFPGSIKRKAAIAKIDAALAKE